MINHKKNCNINYYLHYDEPNETEKHLDNNDDGHVCFVYQSYCFNLMLDDIIDIKSRIIKASEAIVTLNSI